MGRILLSIRSRKDLRITSPREGVYHLVDEQDRVLATSLSAWELYVPCPTCVLKQHLSVREDLHKQTEGRVSTGLFLKL